MSDRGVFVTAFLTVVFIAAAAFVHTHFFLFELAKSSIYVAIAILVFFGEDRYSYMLSMIAPPLWFIVDIMVGSFFRDFPVLLSYLAGKGIAPLETPLHALARLAAVLLFILSLRAWRKEVPERFLGKTFWTCLVICLVYVTVLTGWYLRLFPSGRT